MRPSWKVVLYQENTVAIETITREKEEKGKDKI